MRADSDQLFTIKRQKKLKLLYITRTNNHYLGIAPDLSSRACIPFLKTNPQLFKLIQLISIHLNRPFGRIGPFNSSYPRFSSQPLGWRIIFAILLTQMFHFIPGVCFLWSAAGVIFRNHHWYAVSYNHREF